MKEPVTAALEAMNTRFELVLWGSDSQGLRALAEEALEEVAAVERELSRFRRDSFLSFLHREAAQRPVSVPPDLIELLSLCQAVWAESRGAFDPTVAPYLAERGLDRDAVAETGSGVVGWSSVELDSEARTLRLHDGVKLDLGGVAKGFAIDQAIERLREEGVERAFLHGGTSSGATIGPATGPGFSVGVRRPGSDELVAMLALRDRAFAVSGRDGKQADGQSHIIDPRTGESIESISMTAVVAASAAVADAWSTALLVDGETFEAKLDSYLILRPDGTKTQGGDESVSRFLDGPGARPLP